MLLGTQVLMATRDIRTRPNMTVADWSSEIMHRSEKSESKACLTFDLKFHSYISSISAQLIYHDVNMHAAKIETRSLLQYSVENWKIAGNPKTFGELKNSFEISVSDINRYQVSERFY